MAQEIKNKTIMIMSVVVVLMTLLGYVCGILSHNVTIYRDAQQECYDWLEEKCPQAFNAPFAQEPVYQAPNLMVNYTNGGGDNVQTD